MEGTFWPVVDYEFLDYVVGWGYWGILFWFLTIDNVTPIPQEISLLLIGYFSALGIFQPLIASLTCILAFLIMDLFYYQLARSGNPYVRKKWEEKTWIRNYSRKLEKNMGATLLLLCFIPRMRFISPLLIGILKLSFYRFLFFDTVAIAIFSLFYIFLGKLLQHSIDRCLIFMGEIITVTTLVVMISGATVVAGFLFYHFFSHEKTGHFSSDEISDHQG